MNALRDALAQAPVLRTALQQLAPAAAAHASGTDGLPLGLACLREALAVSGRRLASDSAAPGFLAMVASLTRPADTGACPGLQLSLGHPGGWTSVAFFLKSSMAERLLPMGWGVACT